MPHRKIAEIVTAFQPLSGFDEVASCWLRNRSEMQGFTTLFTFDDVGSELPIQSTLGSYDGEKFSLRSVFSRPKVYFLNDEIWSSMQGWGRVELPVDSVLVLDTQFGGYAVKYVSDPKFRQSELGQSVHSFITYIYEKKIVFDFSFYLFENFANYLAGNKDEIRRQLKALKTIGDADRLEFLSTGGIRLVYGQDQLVSKVEELLSIYQNQEQRLEFAKQELLQSTIATLLLKAILIKKEACSGAEKVEKLIDFLDQNLSSILEKEMVICSKWLLGHSISFFDPVNVGPGYAFVSQKVHGMAWDLMLLRYVEKYCSQTGMGKYTIAYFSSFDRRLVELSDLWKSKGCIYPPSNVLDQYFMLNEENSHLWISSVVGSEKTNAVFNDQAWARRNMNRPYPEEIFAMRRTFEHKVIKMLKPK